MRKLVSGVATAILFAATPAAAAGPGSTPYSSAAAFSSTSVWKTPLAANAPLTANSQAYADKLRNDMGINADGTVRPTTGGQRWMAYEDTYVFDSTAPAPVLARVCGYYVVHNGQTTPAGQTIATWPEMTDLHNAFFDSLVPLPAGFDHGVSGGGPPDGDMAATVFWKDANTEYDLYHIRRPIDPASQTDPAWAAFYAAETNYTRNGKRCDYIAFGGGRIRQLGATSYVRDSLASPGYFRNNAPWEDVSWGRRASGAPVMGGLITWDEWANTDISGDFGHATQTSVGRAGKGFVWPATRGDGGNPFPAVPEGYRWRIDPTYPCPAVSTPPNPFQIMVVRLCNNLKRYGSYITDQTGAGTDVVVLRSASTATAEGGPAPFNLDGHGSGDFATALHNQLAHLQVMAVPAH